MFRKIKNLLSKIFNLYKENSQIILLLFGIKFKFKAPTINQLAEVCCIQNLKYLQEQETYFPHPVGIVIHPDIKIGKNCTIYQNVTVGAGKKNASGCTIPTIGNNVTIYANSVVIGGIKIGNNTIIGANSLVIHNVPANSIVAGSPAKVIKIVNDK